MFDTILEAQTSYGGIPANLDKMVPGTVLAGFLASVADDELTGHDRVIVMRAHQRMASHYAAHVLKDMAQIKDEFAGDYGDERAGADLAADEVRVALRLTRMAADSAMQFAVDLRESLPRVFDAFRSGNIDVRRARVIADGTSHLGDAARTAVVDAVVDDAGKLTTGQLRARIQKICVAVEPEQAAKQYDQALELRRVIAEPTGVGTFNLLGLDMAPDHVAMATRRINKIARSLSGKGETRTMDQRRADAFVDILLGHPTHGEGAVVHMTTDVETLAGVAETPGDLNGYGPVIADIARQVADEQERAEWRYSVVHPETGMPLYVGTTSRRPTASMRRRTHARDETCVFPGCRAPAPDCDIDHIDPWSNGGATSGRNSAPLCERDHSTKDQTDWSYRRLSDGDYLWTSPLGHRYTSSGSDPPL